jgi:hypothetical protein
MLQFDDTGFLKPTEIIISNLEEFRDTFAFNDRRLKLFTTYLDFLSDLEKLELGAFFQWIDGSFTTKKPFPNDIDLVVFVDFNTYKSKKSRLVYLKESYKSRGLDVYFETYYPEQHPFYPKFLYQTAYWFKVYSFTRPLGLQQLVRRKGIIQIDF